MHCLELLNSRLEIIKGHILLIIGRKVNVNFLDLGLCIAFGLCLGNFIIGSNNFAVGNRSCCISVLGSLRNGRFSSRFFDNRFSGGIEHLLHSLDLGIFRKIGKNALFVNAAEIRKIGILGLM